MKTPPSGEPRKLFHWLIALASTAALLLPGCASVSWADGDVPLQRFLELAQRVAPLMGPDTLALDQAVASISGEITNRGGNDERGGNRWMRIEGNGYISVIDFEMHRSLSVVKRITLYPGDGLWVPFHEIETIFGPWKPIVISKTSLVWFNLRNSEGRAIARLNVSITDPPTYPRSKVLSLDFLLPRTNEETSHD